MNVLIVDDHAVVRRGLAEILTDEFAGVEIGHADTVAEARGSLREGDWDLAIVDIALPKESGLMLLKEIRDTWSDLPVLVLSFHPEKRYALRALRAGAAGYLTKEAAPDELVSAVRKVLDGGKYVTQSIAERLAFRVEDGSGEAPHERLSDREYQVMVRLASGKTVSQIADEMHLSVNTISTYRSRLLDKMDMETNAEVTRYAV
ncbi:MAG: response regulator transcription factor, partial [Planctomycetota bacterium]